MNGKRDFPGYFAWALLGGVAVIWGIVSSCGVAQDTATRFSDLISSGKGYFVCEEYENARESFLTAMQIDSGQRHPAEEIDGLIKLALISWNMDSVLEARTYFRRGKDLAERSGHPSSSRYCRIALDTIQLYEAGKRQEKEGNIEFALRNYKHAILLAEAIGADDLVQKCLRSASVAFWRVADYESHLAWARKSLAYARRLGLKREMCLCLHGIGLNFFMRGVYSEALKNIEMDLAILRELNEPSLVADCYNVIELVFYTLGDYRRAYSYAKKEKELLEKIGEIDAIHIPYCNLAMCLVRQSLENNDFQGVKRGISILNQVVDMARARKDDSGETRCLNSIGFYYYRIGEHELALSYLQRAFQLAESDGKNTENSDMKKIALSNIALVEIERNNIRDAYSILSRLAEEGGGDLFRKQLWEVYYGLGLCKEKGGNDEAALSCYEKAVTLIEEAKAQISVDFYRASYQREKSMVYERIIGLYFKRYKANCLPDELLRLFMAVERIKARTFLESLLEKKGEPNDVHLTKANSDEVPLNEKAGRISGRPSIYIDRNEKRRASYDLLKMAEDTEARSLLSRLSSPQVPHDNSIFEEGIVRRLQEFMPEGRMAVLEYYLGKERSLLFLITKKDMKLFELPPADAIRESLKAVVKMIATVEAEVQSCQQALDRMGSELLFPLQEAGLAAVETLVIIPDGFLYYVPFEAANIDRSGKSRYAVDKYRISYAPSSKSLVFLLQQKRIEGTRKEFLAVGNPATAPSSTGRNFAPPSRLWSDFFFYGRPKSPGLPFSEGEAVELAGHFPPGSVDILLGEEAKERTVKATALEDYRLIHFACHAFLDSESAFRSALLLAPDENGEEDGFLQVSEIYDLKMDADLVVLSACQTAHGILQKGEGVFGLSRTFFHAGARAVLSTLWPVSDKASAGFMKSFYHYLTEGYSKSEALRQAKLEMIRSRYAHPAYWAAYVLNGDYRASYPN